MSKQILRGYRKFFRSLGTPPAMTKNRTYAGLARSGFELNRESDTGSVRSR